MAREDSQHGTDLLNSLPSVFGTPQPARLLEYDIVVIQHRLGGDALVDIDAKTADTLNSSSTGLHVFPNLKHSIPSTM